MYTIPLLASYGSVRKIHGHRGEVVIDLEDESLFDLDPDFIFVEREGIPVPFAVEFLRGDVSRLICKFARVSTDVEAETLRGAKLFIPEADLPEDFESEDSIDSYIVGYEIRHPKSGVIGEVLDLDTSTPNVLLLIKSAEEGRELLLPFVEDWVIDLDEEGKTMTYDCPLDLLTL